MSPITIEEFEKLAPQRVRGAQVSNEKLLEFLANQAATTKEIAEFLGVQTGTAYSRLRRLLQDGVVRRMYKGNVSYWAAIKK